MGFASFPRCLPAKTDSGRSLAMRCDFFDFMYDLSLGRRVQLWLWPETSKAALLLAMGVLEGSYGIYNAHEPVFLSPASSMTSHHFSLPSQYFNPPSQAALLAAVP